MKMGKMKKMDGLAKRKSFLLSRAKARESKFLLFSPRAL
jgi:hypothetical protein